MGLVHEALPRVQLDWGMGMREGKKWVRLRPVRTPVSDLDRVQQQIILLLKKELYQPLLDELNVGSSVLQNSLDDLVQAIRSGRLSYDQGVFKGRLNSTLSRELRRIGAKWDRKTGGFLIPQSELPPDLRIAISASYAKFKQTGQRIADKLSQIVPSELASKLNLDRIFDSTLYKVDQDLNKTLDKITVPAQLTPERRARIAAEYTKNLQLYIEDFTQKEIVELRQRIQEKSFSGVRYESYIDEIQKSYGVGYNKAKFLAHQETNLLVTKFKQVRYQDSGVNDYIWKCVVGSPLHPVRPLHEKQNGKQFTWDNPPVVTEDGQRKNPGQDYNCRCIAIPVVKF